MINHREAGLLSLYDKSRWILILTDLNYKQMKKILFSLAIGTAIAFSACEKEVDPASDYSSPDFSVTVESIVTTDASVEDVVEAMDSEVDLFTGSADAISDVFAQVSDDGLKSSNIGHKARYKNGVCPEVTFATTEGGFPKTIKLNYGEETVLVNGRVLSGVITIEISAPFNTVGATHSVTFIGFGVDSVSISGTKVRTLVNNTDGRKVNIVRDLVLTLPDGTIINNAAEITRNWTEGISTPYIYSDNVFEITGFSSFTDSEGNVYSKSIIEKLVKKGDCRFIVSGLVELSYNTKMFASIDYGDGSCNNLATMTTSKGRKEFIIGKRLRNRVLNR